MADEKWWTVRPILPQVTRNYAVFHFMWKFGVPMSDGHRMVEAYCSLLTHYGGLLKAKLGV